VAEPLVTRRGTLPVPVFLPDATRAGVRGVGSDDLRAVGIEGLVVNAFHLLRRPGARVIQAAGIDERELTAPPLRGGVDAVTRGAGQILHDRDALADDPVEERRLPDVGPADNGNDRAGHAA
jgi:hypothetical protein